VPLKLSDAITMDRARSRWIGIPSGQVVHDPVTGATGILHVQSTNPGQDSQLGFMHRYRPLAQRGPRQPKQQPLPADAELGVVLIDQSAQFTGVRAAETFLTHSSFIFSRLICWNSSASLSLHLLARVNSSLASSRSCRFPGSPGSVGWRARRRSHGSSTGH